MRDRFERNGHDGNGHANNGQIVAESHELIAELPAVRPIDAYDGERWYPIQQQTSSCREEIAHCLSVTTVLGYAWPKDKHLLDWMVKNGAQGEKIRDEKARIGSNVDRGTQLIDKGMTLHRKDYSREEYKALISYLNFLEDTAAEILVNQRTVYDLDDRVAGTLDKMALIQKQLVLLEIKCTSGIYPTHRIQAQTYGRLARVMGVNVETIGVLRLGTKHKKGYEFVVEELDEGAYQLFLACKELWEFCHDYRDGPRPAERLPETIAKPGAEKHESNGHRMRR